MNKKQVLQLVDKGSSPTDGNGFAVKLTLTVVGN